MLAAASDARRRRPTEAGILESRNDPMPRVLAGVLLVLMPNAGAVVRFSQLVLTLSVIAFSGSAAVLAQSGAASAETLARALQQRYAMVRDFRATFVQTSRGGMLKINKPSARGEGTVAVKKPGRMLWNYTKPDKQFILSDGSRIYSCDLETKECDAPVAAPRDDEAPSAALFLTGKGDIVRDFKVARVESPVPGTLALRLEPVKPDPDYEYFVVAFEPSPVAFHALQRRVGSRRARCGRMSGNEPVNPIILSSSPRRKRRSRKISRISCAGQRLHPVGDRAERVDSGARGWIPVFRVHAARSTCDGLRADIAHAIADLRVLHSTQRPLRQSPATDWP